MKTGISCRLSGAENGPKRVLTSPSVRTEILADLLGRGIQCRFVARGSSMRPLIRDGDVIVLSPYGNRSPRVGEVVAAIHPVTGRLLVHRVIGKRRGGYLTKGDNAATTDGWFLDNHLPGRVSQVLRSGRANGFGLGREGAFVALLSRLGLFLGLVSCCRVLAPLSGRKE
jgi:signal peptidase I